MVLYMYEHNILIYAVGILFMVGIVSKILLAIAYSRLIHGAKEMGNSKNKLMKQICLRFDTCYKIKLGVHNVDTLVDKYVYSYKFCGISLYTLGNIGGQINMISLLVGLIGGMGAIYLKCGQDVILSTFAVGAASSVLLIAFENVVSLVEKQKILRIHMKDYLENNLKAKLENEYFVPEEMEEYRNNYFERKKKEEDAGVKIEKIVENTKKSQEDEKIIEDILKEYFV
ncbi:MAG: hypothetical protein RR056_07635 [Acetivibrio sp.]